MKTLDQIQEDLYEQYLKSYSLKETGKEMVQKIVDNLEKEESVDAALTTMNALLGEYELITIPVDEDEARQTAKREVLYSHVCMGLHRKLSYITAKNLWSTYIGNNKDYNKL